MGKQAFIVTGLGYGDEGKGTTVHWLSCRHKAHTVIRTGGAQALHHVVAANGKEHVFSQFGSGTFRGSATHLSRDMVVDTHSLLSEGEALIYESGMSGIFEIMTIHEDALMITPYQALAGRLRELLRGKNRRGSVGIGIGETVLDAEALGDGAIRAKDLANPTLLREKLAAVQRHKWAEFESYADRASKIPPESEELARSQLALINDEGIFEWAMGRYAELARRVRIVDTDYVASEILGQEGTVVFEGSQGVLLDRHYGFHPYITKVRTVPAIAYSIIRDCGYEGDVQSLGIMRAYQTRHGAGPFVSESADFTRELPDAMNKEHPWQGKFRVGPLDLVATNYALEACAGMIDGLVVTCLDRIVPRGSWQFCDYYHAPRNPETESLFRFEGERAVEIRAGVYTNPADASARQEKISEALTACTPHVRTIDLSNLSEQKFINVSASIIGKALDVPVVATSMGPTEDDKREI